ncbi:MAG: sodium:solute symporter [Cytophagales bacterium]|nr:sodium:solute symporter [Cytophagales bacterium]
MTSYDFWSIIPPILAIALAIKTKQVIPSLLAGLFAGWIIINNGNPFTGLLDTLNGLVNVFQSSGNTRTVLFTLFIGALIQLIRHAGGVSGFINSISKKFENAESPTKRLQAGAALTGFLIFIESNISILTVGTVFRPLFDTYKLSREKLAYLADSSSAPSSILFPVNAWGAYIMGLLAVYESIDPFQALIYSIPFNFYAILTLLMVFWMATKGKDFGPMKNTQPKPVQETSINVESKGKAINMILPLLIMILSMPLFLVFTGWDPEATGSLSERIWQSISDGSGSQAVMFAVCFALLFAGIQFAINGLVTLKSFTEQSLKGMNEMLTMAILMVLAFALGDLCNTLGTGNYVAEVTSSWLSPSLAPALIFAISCFIAFATGTSWGTFAIMMSIAMPLGISIDANIYLMIAAVLGGGVFGDHCSPISDTTLISSMAAGCDHIEHVRTQLPYALITGGISIILYLVAGFVL